jgi:hypothetical protein
MLSINRPTSLNGALKTSVTLTVTPLSRGPSYGRDVAKWSAALIDMQASERSCRDGVETPAFEGDGGGSANVRRRTS